MLCEADTGLQERAHPHSHQTHFQPGVGPPALHAQLGEPSPVLPQLLCPPSLSHQHHLCSVLLKVPAPPALPTPGVTSSPSSVPCSLCSGSCPVCSSWDEDWPYTDLAEAKSHCKSPHSCPRLSKDTQMERCLCGGEEPFHPPATSVFQTATCCHSSVELQELSANTAKAPGETQ